MNLEAIWMSPWVIRLEYGLKAHKEQALRGSKANGRPPLLNEGYLGPFDGLRAYIKSPLPNLAIT